MRGTDKYAMHSSPSPPSYSSKTCGHVGTRASPAMDIREGEEDEDARSVGLRKRCAVDGCERPRERAGYCMACSARFGAAHEVTNPEPRQRSVSDVELSALIRKREDELRAVELKLQALQARESSEETPAVAALRIVQDMSRAAFKKALETKKGRRRTLVSKGSADLVSDEYTQRAVLRFHSHYDRVVRSELARTGSLGSDTLCVMAVLVELRQLVVTVFDYGKRQRSTSDHIFRELAFVNRTTLDLENVRQKLFFKQTKSAPSERGTSASPRSPRPPRLGPSSAAASSAGGGDSAQSMVLAHAAEVALEFLEERLELFSEEDRGRLFRLVPEVRDLAKQVELLRAQQHEETLVLLVLAETFGRALCAVARSTELRHKMLSPLLAVFAHARGSAWTALRSVHGLRLTKQADEDVSRPHVPAEWSEYHTDAGVPYYVNKRTGETRWEQPFAE